MVNKYDGYVCKYLIEKSSRKKWSKGYSLSFCHGNLWVWEFQNLSLNLERNLFIKLFEIWFEKVKCKNIVHKVYQHLRNPLIKWKRRDTMVKEDLTLLNYDHTLIFFSLKQNPKL